MPSCRGEVDRVTGRYVAGLSWLGLSGRWFSGLLHEGVGFAVAVALESDHPAVVDGAVDDRGGHVGVAEDPAPSAELDVGGVDDALSFVRVGDDLEQEAAAFLVDRDVSELVDDQEPGPADLGELPVEPVLRVGAQ